MHKVDDKDWKREVKGKTPFQWDVQLETLVVLLALRLSEVRTNVNPSVIVKDLNYRYLAKGRSGVKGPKENYVPTQHQRNILKNTGY